MQPVVLLFGMEEQRVGKVRMLGILQKVKVLVVPQEAYGESLAALFGIEEKTGASPQGPLEEEMMVMAGFSRQQFQGFLDSFRKKKIPTVALKAILTESNQHWDAYALQKELQRERAAYASMGKG